MIHQHTPDGASAIDDAILGIAITDDNAEFIAKALEQRSEYKILRELDLRAGLDALPSVSPGEKIGVVLDIETTGLDYELDRPIEISVQRFLFDAVGKITNVQRPLSWLEDPGCVLPPQISKITGIVDADIKGKSFDDEALTSALTGSDLIVAHNARFDRPFVDRRFPHLADKNWACSLTQLSWPDLGFDGRSLGYLVMQAGWFFRGHRAQNDVLALTTLLGTSVAGGRTILSHLLERSGMTTVRIDAVNAPFSAKAALRENGYRWNSTQRVWAKEVSAEDVAAETLWLDYNVYKGFGGANFRTLTPKDRFKQGC